MGNSTDDWMQWIDGLGKTVKIGLEKLNDWLERPETQAAFQAIAQMPDAVRTRVRIQRRFLKQRLLPSDPLSRHVDDLSNLTPRLASEIYADALDERSLTAEAERLRAIGSVAALGIAVHSLRIIFPEIEAVARRNFYPPGAGDRIASLLELRIGIVDLQMQSPLGIAMEMMAAEWFTFVNLAALDYTYARSNERLWRKYPRLFSRVANRHFVCHGFDSNYDSTHVVNALTLLYTTIVVCDFMVTKGMASTDLAKKADDILGVKRAEQRELHRATMSLVTSLPGPGR